MTSTGRLGLIGAALVTLASTAGIVSTYYQLSHTWDEGTHVSAGLEYLQDGRYALQTENPPLARVTLAIVPYLLGAELQPPEQRDYRSTTDVFYRTPNYIRHVTEARVANLLFFWLCVGFTWLLAGGRSDPWVAFMATAAMATLPPIVAHSGFATTDIAFVAAFLLTLIALRHFLNTPTITSGMLLGVAVGVAVGTKFSTLVFLPPAAVAIAVCHYWPPRRDWIRSAVQPMTVMALSAAAFCAVLAIWATYGFHVGRLADLPTEFGPYGAMPQTGWPTYIRNWTIPGHEFVHGLLYLQTHTIFGHPSVLLGETSRRGFLLFYPILLLTKTPGPFLVFAVLGLWGLRYMAASPSRRWFLGLSFGALGVLLVSLSSPINIGVRHVLVIYPLVAISASYGLIRWAETVRNRQLVLRGIGIGCLALQFVLLAVSIPNQVTYYNVLAGSDPAHVSSISDFDWGQDMLALERYVAEHPIPELYLLQQGTTRACSHELPPLKALPPHPVTGWVAISERHFRKNGGGRRDPCGPPFGITAEDGWLDWLHALEPVAIVGKTIRLYNIPN